MTTGEQVILRIPTNVEDIIPPEGCPMSGVDNYVNQQLKAFDERVDDLETSHETLARLVREMHKKLDTILNVLNGRRAVCPASFKKKK